MTLRRPDAQTLRRSDAVFVYQFGRNLYINLTNRCPTACFFCVKRDWRYRFRGSDLALAREPTAEEVLSAVERHSPPRPSPRKRGEGDRRAPSSHSWEEGRGGEVVFCGFGEPTLRMDVLTAVGRRLRAAGRRVRLNTVGLGSLVNGRDIVPELAAAVDAVSVSLNTADPAQWTALHRPARRWAPQAAQAARRFVADCVRAGIPTTVTAIALPGVDTEAVKALAGRLGAKFRLRPALDGSTK